MIEFMFIMLIVNIIRMVVEGMGTDHTPRQKPPAPIPGTPPEWWDK